MMETLKIKDLLILLCIHPQKGWVRKRNVISYALLAAALFDLSLIGKFSIVKGRIETQAGNTNDPLLDEVLKKIKKLEGKKVSVVWGRFSIGLEKNVKIQMKFLEDTRQISSRPLTWMGINWGKRYRVNRIDSLKPVITEMDRVLIYGRKPVLRIRLIIELLGLLDVLSFYFPDGELKKRTRQRFKEIFRQPFDTNNETLTLIHKGLHQILQVKHA